MGRGLGLFLVFSLVCVGAGCRFDPTYSVPGRDGAREDGPAVDVPRDGGMDVRLDALVDSRLDAPVPVCGNGVAEAGEECDGSDLAGETCRSQGFVGGQLLCKGDCTFDVSRCSNCGDGVLGDGEECDDGNRRSGDGCDAECHVEDYFVCDGEPSACVCRVYVDDTPATNSPDGRSWLSAFIDVREAISLAGQIVSGAPGGVRCEVWIGDGTYSVDDGTGSGLALVPGVDLYGGFCGGEASLDDRSLDAGCDSVLDGGGTVRSVLVASGPGDSILDGLWVIGGNGDAGGSLRVEDRYVVRARNCHFSDSSAATGGCIWVGGATLNLRDSTVENCAADPGEGGGIAYVDGASGWARDVIVADNFVADSLVSEGGGIFVGTGSHVTLLRTNLERNQSVWGAGMEVSSATVSATRLLVRGNVAGDWAGGLGVYDADVTVAVSQFEGNDGGNIGGGVAAWGDGGTVTHLVLRRCLLQDNTVAYRGGGIHVWARQSNTTVEVWVRDSILWNNSLTSEVRGGASLWAGKDQWAGGVTVHMWNVTVWGGQLPSGGAGRAGGLVFDGRGVVGDVWNTIAWNCDGRELAVRNGARVGLHASDVDSVGTWNNGTVDPNENLDEDPGFADPDAGDFSLQSDSGCLDMGVDENLSSKDFLGHTRAVDIQDVGHDGSNVVDLGAIERQGP